MKQTPFPGDDLRQRREALGLSEGDVFRTIYVPVRYVRAMEEGDFSTVPSLCYAAGFVRTYCKFLQLEPERYIDRLHACTQPAHGVLRPDTAASSGSQPAWLQDVIAWAAICALIAFGWFAYSVVFRPNADVNETRVEAGDVDESQTSSAPAD